MSLIHLLLWRESLTSEMEHLVNIYGWKNFLMFPKISGSNQEVSTTLTVQMEAKKSVDTFTNPISTIFLYLQYHNQDILFQQTTTKLLSGWWKTLLILEN